jgi:hypothetical protein
MYHAQIKHKVWADNKLLPIMTQLQQVQSEGDPIPGLDVKLGKNPGSLSGGAGVSSGGDPTVEAEQSNAYSMEQNLTAEQNAETGHDLSTNEWAG